MVHVGNDRDIPYMLHVLICRLPAQGAGSQAGYTALVRQKVKNAKFRTSGWTPAGMRFKYFQARVIKGLPGCCSFQPGCI
jgi:hypothetical protein